MKKEGAEKKGIGRRWSIWKRETETEEIRKEKEDLINVKKGEEERKRRGR